MTLSETRLQNLKQLIKRESSQSVFAKKVDIDPSHISQIKSSKSKKNLGEKLARKIETALGLKNGWMDTDHSQATTDLNSLISVATPTYLKELEQLQQAENQGVLDKDDKKLITIIANKYKDRLK